MYQQETTPVAPKPANAQTTQEFYLPRGEGIDPDFYVPLDREHTPGRISRWVSALGFRRN